MKKIVSTLFLFMGLLGFSQTNGITYQALILNPSGEQLPGVNNTTAPLTNKSICLKFSILDQNLQSEYIETVQTSTDEFGMVNLIIGTGVQIGGYASSFSNILWNANPKSLKVDLSITGICSYYTEISNQPFTAVPFALFALNTESAAALAALQSTVAANATATTTALALKEDAINKSTTTSLGTSNVLFPTQNAVKTYVDGNITTVNANNTALQATVIANATAATNAIAAVQADVNQNEADSDVADVILQNNITSLQATVTSNATTTTTALGLKEDAINKSTTTTLGASDILFPTQNAVKTYVDTNITTVNATNAALQATVTSNAAATTTALGLKEDAINKSTTTTLGTSNVLFPTQNAVKTYVDNQVSNGIATNVSGIVEIANGGTGSSVQNFVDLTNNQNIAGEKYFTNNISANQVSIGSPNSGSQNTMLGAVSFGYASPGNNNTALGFFTLATLNGGNDNTAVGTNAIRQGGAANGSRNSALGSSALTNGSEPNDNTALGYATLAVTSGSSNTAVGSSALQSNTSANYNVGVGFETLRNTTSGGSNTAVGRGAMYSNTSGDVNTAVGEYALVSNTNGRYNTSIGVQSQEQNTTGQSNTAIGVAAIDRNVAGNYNAVLGAFAGRYIADNSTFNTAIDNSVLIGALSRPLGNNANNEIVIGYNAIGNGSNTIQLGNTSITNVNTSGSITANAEISSEITANLIINNANAEQYKAKVLICNPSSQITITFNNDLPVGFNCMVLQKSADANKINLAGGSGVTIKNRNNYTATAGSYAMATIVNIGGGILVTAGDMQ